MNMDKFFLLISSLLLLTSCAEQYNIAGNSSVSCLDGRTLYLRDTPENLSSRTMAVQHEQNGCIDSCKVIHGRFSFAGDVDSVRMVLLYSGSQCVMPMVIENGNLSVQVDNVGQRVSGGPLNDKLYRFFQKKNRLDNEMWELQQRTICMIREGETLEAIEKKMGSKARKLAQKAEDLETNFVMENYSNALGTGFFQLLCSQYPTPVMTGQIQRIVEKAPSSFLNNPFVRSYVTQARLRMEAHDKALQQQEGCGTITVTHSVTFP